MAIPVTDLSNLNLAVLIDADNAPRTMIRNIMQEIAIYGTPTVKRIYGDWTSPNLGSWKMALLENAITPVQQYSYTTGKIDRLRDDNRRDGHPLLRHVGGFVIVSSDSDYPPCNAYQGIRPAGDWNRRKEDPRPLLLPATSLFMLSSYARNTRNRTNRRLSPSRAAQPREGRISPIPPETVRLIADSCPT